MAEPGRRLFTDVAPRNVNRVLKTVFRKMKLPRAERYTSHGFRRGGAHELKERGIGRPMDYSSRCRGLGIFSFPMVC